MVAKKKKKTKENNELSMISAAFEVFFGLIAFALIGIFYETAWNNSPSSIWPDSMAENAVPEIFNLFSTPIESVRWSEIEGGSHSAKMSQICRMRKPLIIKESPATYWRANREWKLSNIDRLAQLGSDRISVIRQNKSFFFTFSDFSRPFARYDMHSNAQSEQVNVSLVAFLDFIKNKKYSALNANDSYLFYSDSITQFVDDLAPINWFKAKHKTIKFSASHFRKLSDFNDIFLEVSPPKFFINSHYEITHNFFYQIVGNRNFLISPPSESLKLRSFPEGHPSYRSSQIPFKFYFIPTDEWISRKSLPFELGQAINAWNVSLKPGDLLYVPPFYWTQMTTLRSRISVKLSSLGFEQIFVSLSDPNLLPPILQQPNFENAQKQKFKLHQLAFFLRTLIDRILKVLPDERDNANKRDLRLVSEFDDELKWENVHKWIEEQLLNGRYRGNALWHQMQCAYFDAVRCPQRGNSTEQIMKRMEQTARTWAYAYKQMREYVTDREDAHFIRNQMLAAHIEQFVSHITGHDNYCYFIQCLVSGRFGSLFVETEQEALKREMEQRMQQQAM